jgi:purine nucleosidase
MGTIGMANPRKIIIDTDPGQDDAAAIMLAFGSPEELDVLGITTVAGNVPLSYTSRNARIVCELCGRTDTKVFAGADKPIARTARPASTVRFSTSPRCRCRRSIRWISSSRRCAASRKAQ